MIGERTRAALEREKMLALRSIKELEFDRAMGKLSDDDLRRDVGPPARPRGAADAAARRRRRLPRADRARSREAPRRATPTAATAARRPTRACAAVRDRERRRRAVLQELRATAVTRDRDDGHEGHEARDGRQARRREAASGASCVSSASRVLARASARSSRCPIRSRCRASRGRSTTCRTAAVSVRLIRGALSNNIAEPPGRAARRRRRSHDGQDRRERPRAVRRPAAGRDGEGRRPSSTASSSSRRSSRRPPQGGIRLMLVATDKVEGSAGRRRPAAPAVTGQVVARRRVAHRHRAGRRDACSVYYLLDIVEQRRARR